MTNTEGRLVITSVDDWSKLQYAIIGSVQFVTVLAILYCFRCPWSVTWLVAVGMTIPGLLQTFGVIRFHVDLILDRDGFGYGRKLYYTWWEVEKFRLKQGGPYTIIEFDFVQGARETLVKYKRKRWGPKWCPSLNGHFDKPGEEVFTLVQEWKARYG